MSTNPQQLECIDVRRVIDRAACDWSLSGHRRSLHMILPAGQLHACGDAGRLGRLLVGVMERAGRSANRFETMLLVVERMANQIVIHVGTGARAFVDIRLMQSSAQHPGGHA